MATDPNFLIQGLLRGTGFGQTQGELRGQDIQNQQGQQNLQAGALQLQAAHAAQAQEQQYQTDIGDYFKDPRPQKLAMLAAKYPQKADALKQVYSVQNDQQRQSALGVMGGLFNAADAGRADIVTKNLTNVRDAERAQGIDTSEVDGLLADLNSGDAAKIKSAVTMTKGFAQMHLAAINPDKFNETYGVLGKGDAPDEKNHFSTAGDGTIYDQRTGAVVRQGSPKAEYRTVRNADGSESIIQVGGGGQASGSGGGAPNSTTASPRYTGGWTPRARNGGDNSDAAVDSKIAGAAQYLGVDPGADISKLSPMKIAQAMTLSEGGAGSLADRNNNPGNMRNADGTYKKFPTKEAGLAAAAALVARKLRGGQTTVQSLIEGRPVGGAPRSQSGQVVYTSQGTDGGADDIVAGDITTVPTQIRSTVQAVAEGRAAAPRTGSRNGQAILDAVTAFDPTFDAANATSRVKTRVDFTSGKSAQAVNALNTAMGHLLHLDDQAHDLGNFSTAPGILNPIYNTIRERVGNNTALPAFDQTKQAAASEMRKVFAGAGGGSEAELNAWESQLSSSKSYEQLHDVIKNGVTLMGSRLSALQDQYATGMGRSDQIPQMIKPSIARTVKSRFGVDLGSSSGPVHVATPADAARLPSGTLFVTPDGRTLRKH